MYSATDFSGFYFQLLTEFLSTPVGAAAVFLLMVAAVCSVTLPSARWLFVSAALYAATLPINWLINTGVYVPLAFPLEQIRLYARLITILCMAMLLLPLITSDRGWRRRVVSVPLVLFFAFQIGISLRLLAVGGAERGMLSVLSYTVLMLTFGLAVGTWLQSINDVYKLLWAINGSVAVLIIATCYQLAINRFPIIAGGRLSGVTGNPQYMALFVAFTLPNACFLLLHSRKSLRPWLVMQIAVGVVMLAWTGSRTGFLAALVGMVVLFHRRVGGFVVVGLLVCGGVYFALPYFEGTAETASRLFSTENTRAGAWATQMNDIQKNFWFGASRGELNVAENSYLAMLGQLGLFGTLPFIAAWLGGFVVLVRLRGTRTALGDQRSLVDLVTGFFAAIAVAAIGEGFLMGVLVYPVLLVYLFAVIASYLLDHARAVNEQPLEIDGFGEVWPAAA